MRRAWQPHRALRRSLASLFACALAVNRGRWPTVRFLVKLRFTRASRISVRTHSALASKVAACAARSPYEVLGVPVGADKADVKKRYRKLVQTSHPDVNPGDPSAAETFLEITTAYDEIKEGAAALPLTPATVRQQTPGRPRWTGDYADSYTSPPTPGRPQWTSDDAGGDDPPRRSRWSRDDAESRQPSYEDLRDARRQATSGERRQALVAPIVLAFTALLGVGLGVSLAFSGSGPSPSSSSGQRSVETEVRYDVWGRRARRRPG